MRQVCRMRRLSHYDKRRRWWEFSELYRQLSQHSISASSYQIQHSSYLPSDPYAARLHPTSLSWVSTERLVSNLSSYNQSNTLNSSHRLNTLKSNLNNSSQITPKLINSSSRQNQIKRQREWVYLSHYLAIEGLDPVYIISGNDDGREPDFTLIFSKNRELIYIGIELTTLPRLRDRMGEDDLIAKRWYWQGLQVMARQRIKTQEGMRCYENGCYPNFERFKLPVKTLYMPTNQFLKRRKQVTLSRITQQDVNDVMSKKAHKVDGYHARRPLDELWLLVHTDKYQPDCILTEPNPRVSLTHTSGFDQIHITRYPSHKVLKVERLTKS